MLWKKLFLRGLMILVDKHTSTNITHKNNLEAHKLAAGQKGCVLCSFGVGGNVAQGVN